MDEVRSDVHSSLRDQPWTSIRHPDLRWIGSSPAMGTAAKKTTLENPRNNDERKADTDTAKSMIDNVVTRKNKGTEIAF